MRVLCAAALACAACSHLAAGKGAPVQVPSGAVQVQDAIHGVRYDLPPGDDLWQVSREGNARSASGVETEVSSFPLARPGTPAQCRDHARTRLTLSGEKGPPSPESPRDQAASDDPTALWAFTTGPAASPVRNRWAFYARGSDCIVLHVISVPGDTYADQTFVLGARTFQVYRLPEDRQREVDLLAGMGFLERRNAAAALDRFETLATREPDLAKAHFGALMAGFELGPKAYARALPHGELALKADHDLTPEQRQLALRAVGVMQLAENQPRQAADTLAELVVRAPDLAEGQYNYACALARLGDRQGALEHLQTAFKLDGDLAAHARDDDDLKSLRGSKLFEELVTPAPSAGR